MVYHSALKAQDLIDFLKQKKRPQIGHFIPLLKLDPILLDDYNIQFDRSEIDSYLCARIIDYIRLEFLRLKISFTFETVMSHISKVEFLQEAQRQGFKTYLYYVSTVDPLINIARVQYRVSLGGHPVIQSSEKIETIDADLDVKEIEQEQQDKNNSTDVTSGLDVFDLLEDLVSEISLNL
jgi:hypothetical protein